MRVYQFTRKNQDYSEGKRPNQVINARHRFAKRRYDHEFKWKPSRKLEEAIVAAVLRNG